MTGVKVKAKLDLLRLRGNHEYNLKVLANGGTVDDLMLARRENNELVTSDFGPCPKCLIWIKELNMKKHIRFCPAVTSNSVTCAASLIYASRLLSDRADTFQCKYNQ